MPTLIVDASIAVKWLTEEPHSERARAILDSNDALIAPELIIAEVGNALWKKLVRGAVTRPQAAAAIDVLPTLFEALVPMTVLAPRALDLAVDLKHPVYDCFYLALAEREAAALVSADEKLLAAGKRVKGVEVRPL